MWRRSTKNASHGLSVSSNASLDPVLNPRAIAVVGASRDPTKRGYRALQLLIESGFGGKIFPVHPSGGELLGLPVATDIGSITEQVDLAMLATRADTIPGILEQCAAAGVRGVLVSAVGFRESGSDGDRLEQQIREIAKRTGIRMIGPNTSGVINTWSGINLVGARDIKQGDLALLSQSGNVALGFFTEAMTWDAGISVYVGVGNESDILFHEYLDYLGGHDPTRAIAIYVEGFQDGRAFIDVAKRVSRQKPIVLLKGGRTDRGVATARSHTGAVAGSYPVLRAALRRSGVSEVLRSDELFSVTRALADQPPVPVPKAVAVIADGGGHGTLAADALQTLNVPLATFTRETTDRLKTLLDVKGAVHNPLDMAGATDRDPAVFERVFEIVAADSETGGIFLVGLFGGYAIRFHENLAAPELAAAQGIARIMQERALPLVVHSVFAGQRPEPLRALSRANVPIVRSVEVGSRCFRALHARGLFLAEEPVPPVVIATQRTEPEGVLAARRENRLTLLETEVRELLAREGVPLTPASLCRTADEVAQFIAGSKGSVALKVVSAGVPHKSQAGGVALNVTTPDEGRAVFERVIESVSHYALQLGVAPNIRGVLVSPMLTPPVAEVLVGVHEDTQFGPMLTVGTGGVHVEVHRDVALRHLPVGRDEVMEMLSELRLAKLLGGYRGQPPADREALAEMILGVTAAALSHRDIEELEVNPVFAYPDRAVAVDCRAFLRSVTNNGPIGLERPLHERRAGSLLSSFPADD